MVLPLRSLFNSIQETMTPIYSYSRKNDYIQLYPQSLLLLQLSTKLHHQYPPSPAIFIASSFRIIIATKHLATFHERLITIPSPISVFSIGNLADRTIRIKRAASTRLPCTLPHGLGSSFPGRNTSQRYSSGWWSAGISLTPSLKLPTGQESLTNFCAT